MDIYDEILGEYEGDTTKSPIATILNDIREAEKRNQVPLERFTKEQYIQLVNARKRMFYLISPRRKRRSNMQLSNM